MFTQPVSGKEFFGRTEILETISKRVQALGSGYRQNIALTGQMLCGKTSILQHFLNECSDGSFIPIYMEIADKSFPDFAKKFTATVLYTYLKMQGLPVSMDAQKLMEDAKPLIPKTVEAIQRISGCISSKKFNLAYRELLELTSVIKDEIRKPCVVILDEFHNLERFNIKNPFLQLGKIIMIQKDTMYIVSSSQKSTIRKILTEKLSLLFGNFEVIEVSGFDSNTGKAFIRDKISPTAINEYYTDYILALTGMNPFYIDVITGGLKNTTFNTAASRVNFDILKEVLHDCLYKTTGTLNQHFTNHVNYMFDRKTRNDYINILSAIANGKNKIKDIYEYAARTRHLSRKLDDLIRMDIVSKCGSFYYIQDTLMAFWLKNVHTRKTNSLVDNVYDKSKGFMDFIENDIESYLIEYNKGMLERIKELFQAFSGDLVEHENRAFKLPKFTTVESIKYSENESYLIGRMDRASWICRMSFEKLEESDVISFIQFKGREDDAPNKKIMLAFSGVDSNAMLLAKAKHIWIWDAQNINKFFRLYNKHGINI